MQHVRPSFCRPPPPRSLRSRSTSSLAARATRKRGLSNVATQATPGDANNYCAAFCEWSRCGSSPTTRCLPAPRRATATPAAFETPSHAAPSAAARSPERRDVLLDARLQSRRVLLRRRRCNQRPGVTDIKGCRCLNKYNQCDGVFSDEKCNSIAALTQDHRTAADACTTNSDCNAIDKCLSAAGAFDDEQ